MPSVLINMMDKEYSKIVSSAVTAYRRDVASYHDISIRIFAMSPARMLFSDNHVLVLPYREAGFITEERLAL